jgi:hypothetical protein
MHEAEHIPCHKNNRNVITDIISKKAVNITVSHAAKQRIHRQSCGQAPVARRGSVLL